MTMHSLPVRDHASAARTTLSQLRRPRLLIRAARYALGDYERQKGLARIFGDVIERPTTDLLTPLIAREAEIDESRRNGAADYSVSRHIEVLVAVMAEARIQNAGADT